LFPIIYSFSRYWFVEREGVGAAALKHGPTKKRKKVNGNHYFDSISGLIINHMNRVIFTKNESTRNKIHIQPQKF
jgi:hypothetical protein